MLLKIVYLLTCRVLGLAVLVFRGDRAKDAERQFLHAQAAGIVAVDFLHVDTVLLRRLYVLVFIEHGTRQMHLGGVTANPTGEWTVQQARNLALSFGERFGDVKFLIRDRGSNFTASFDAVFQAAGTRILRTAVQAPRMNAICQRLVGTLRREPNGAGKTTLVRILKTLLKPDSGRASVAGYDVTADPGSVRSAIGLAGQYAAVDELLTGRENLELVGLLYHLGRAERRRRAQQALERFSLTGAGDQLVKTYSGGMRRDAQAVRVLTLDDLRLTYVVDGAMGMKPDAFFSDLPAGY